jgi:hypothetical protein
MRAFGAKSHSREESVTELGAGMTIRLGYRPTIQLVLALPPRPVSVHVSGESAGAHWEMTMDEIMQLESPVRADGNWWNDTGLKRVNAVVIIAGCTLAATTYRAQQQRLLDVINRSFVANSHRIGKEFLPLTEVEAFFDSGEKEYLASTHINKSSILFVAERSGGQPDRSGVPEAEAKLLRPKMVVSARVDIPPYTLYGKMYAELQQGLVHVIEGEEMFLPMTDVFISPPLPTGEWKFSFVAINKHQIVRVEDSLAAPKIPVPAVRKVRRRKPKVAASSPSSLELAGTGADRPVVRRKAQNPRGRPGVPKVAITDPDALILVK